LFAATLVMLVTTRASASYHLMKVVEVFAGPNASYVQLEMYSAGQNFVGNKVLHVYNAAGAEIAASTLTLAGSVGNGNDQANILIGTSGVMAAFGVAPDFTLPANLAQAGGAVCFDVVDCFAWGNFTGTLGDTTTMPFAALDGVKAARRTITGGTSATLLDAADDTNKSVTDFTAVTPAPKNNSFGATPPKDAGAADGSTMTPDSGVGTMPSPNNPVVTPDSGTPSGADPGSGGDDSGCSFAARSADGWSSALGLFAAAGILVMARRRRARR
jgi:hypothetical protein